MSDTPGAAAPAAPGGFTNGDMVRHLANGAPAGPLLGNDDGVASSYPGGGFTSDQLEKMAGWAVEDGSMTREQADALLAADGVVPKQASADPAGEHLKSLGLGFEPAEDATKYQLPRFAPDNARTADVMAFDKEARGFLHSARLPAAIGSAIAEESSRTVARLERMDDGERASWAAEQRGQLQRMWGAEYQTRLGLARQLVAEVDKASGGKLIPYLEATGIGDSAFVIGQLSEHGYRLSLRK